MEKQYDCSLSRDNNVSFLNKSSQSYGVSLAIWDPTMLPATQHKSMHPTLTPARQDDTRFTYLEGWKAELT